MAAALANPVNEHIDDAEGAACESLEVQDSGDDLQGPHNWRHNLRHVDKQNNNDFSESDLVDNIAEEGADNSNHKSPNSATEPKEISRPNDVKINYKLKPMSTPIWKQALMIKGTQQVVGKHDQVSAASKSTAQAPKRRSLTSGAESAFTQQVVIPVQRKRVSPSNSFRQNNQGASTANTELNKKRIERVQRARLYLLQQNGPNSFLIGGDSPDHKFRVIIGPQTCNCGRGPHCVHILFVMLRVFKLCETDPHLVSKTLKNYEVENLFRVYHDKQSSRINKRKTIKRKRSKVTSDDVMTNSSESINLPNESDASSTREEEDTCPICLLEMFEGESLLKCESSCQNRLHHHCIAIWFEDRRRQNEPLICPLCRSLWTASAVEIKSTQNNGQEAPPNTRVSSPQQPTESEMILPYAEPIPQEHTDIAAPWITVLGEDLVNCLFSRNWSIRETGLKHLVKEVVATLIRGMGEGRNGVVVSSAQLAANHQMLETCCNILAFMCADPVYRVFVASLRTMRTMLSYTPCRDDAQKQRLQTLLKPIVDAIIIKCTDGNRRTSQLSISTLVELAKGQAGELAVGREIVDPGTEGMDGLSFVLTCTTEDYDDNVQWQWLLGRLYVIDKLIDTFHDQFILCSADPFAPNGGGAAAGPDDQCSPPLPTNSTKILDVAQFSIKAVCNAHSNISNLAKRIFLAAAKLSMHVESVIKELEKLLSQIENSAVSGLKRKLAKIVNNHKLSEKIFQELHHGSGHDADFNDNTPPSSPMDSPVSTPRCNSPVTETPNDVNGNRSIPKVPPNTPTHRSQRRGCRKIPKELIDKAVSPSLRDIESGDDTIQAHIPFAQLRKLRRDRSVENNKHLTGLYCVPEDTATPNSCENKINNAQELSNKTNAMLQGTVCRMIPKDLIPKPEVESFAGDDVHSIPVLNLSESIPELENEDSISSVQGDTGSICGAQTDLESIPEYPGDGESILELGDEEASIIDSIPSSSVGEDVRYISDNEENKMCNSNRNHKLTPVCCCNCHSSAAGGDIAHSGAGAAANTPDEGSMYVFHTADQETLSSDDMLEFQCQPSPGTSDRPVSFITEVTQSPSTSPNHAREHDRLSDCPCKDEVEKEEAVVLAKALAVSERSDACPVVPGLTPTSREEVITIRIQPENYTECDLRESGPSIYLEHIHWVKGPLLGTGAFSTCYQARDARTGVIMAVKQISFCRNSASEQDKVIEAISEEIHMMSRLNHANVVRIFGATKQGCHFNMFVEWMPGGSVAYLLSHYGAFLEEVILNYTKQCLLGLSYLHDNHILHRDLKGANLLVDSTGKKLRIGDFGAAARLASQATGAGEFQGQLLGTIAFMAPEVLRGFSYGRACDIWSAGCVIIEMATARPPWNAQDVSNHLALIFKIASSVEPPPIPEHLSQPLRDLLLRCLEQNSDDRPSSKDLLIHPVF